MSSYKKRVQNVISDCDSSWWLFEDFCSDPAQSLIISSTNFLCWAKFTFEGKRIISYRPTPASWSRKSFLRRANSASVEKDEVLPHVEGHEWWFRWHFPFKAIYPDVLLDEWHECIRSPHHIFEFLAFPHWRNQRHMLTHPMRPQNRSQYYIIL